MNTAELARLAPAATARTFTRPIAEPDLQPLMELYGDERVTRFLPYATWRSAADAQTWWRQVLRIPAQLHVVVDRRSGGVIGTCFLYGYQKVSGAARLGYALAHSHWGQGYMREALGAIAASAFLQAGVQCLQAEVDPRNHRSVNVLRSLGFENAADASSDIAGVQAFCLPRQRWQQALVIASRETLRSPSPAQPLRSLA